MDEDKLERYFYEGMSDPTVKPLFEKFLEWRRHNGIAWKELVIMLKRAENGEFK